MKTGFKIGDVSDKTGLTIYTLRYYEKEGLLPPIPRDKQLNGKRIYSDDHIFWIELVRCLRETGMPLDKIREIVRLSIIGDETIEERKSILFEHEKAVVEKIEDLNKTLKKIRKKIAFYNGETDKC